MDNLYASPHAGTPGLSTGKERVIPKGQHYVCKIRGGFGAPSNPLETWEFSLSINADGVPIANEGQTIAAAMATSWSSNLKSLLPAYAFGGVADVRYIGANGLQAKDATGAYIGTGLAGTMVAGTGGTSPVLGPQNALVVSLTTSRAGASGKGRLFLPAPSTSLDSQTFLITQTESDSAKIGVVNLINALNAAADPLNLVGRVSVMSTKGFASEVKGVRCGRVIDTHRSRRADLRETYGTTTAVT